MENVFEQLFTGLDFKCNWSRKNCCMACTQNKFIERVIASYIKQFRYSTIYQVLSVLLNYHFVNTHWGRGGPKRHVHLSQTRPARLMSCKATGFVPSKPHNNYCYTATERFCVEAQKKRITVSLFNLRYAKRPTSMLLAQPWSREPFLFARVLGGKGCR